MGRLRLAAMLLLVMHLQAPVRAEQTHEQRASALVAQLGDPKYAQRERAMKELSAMGKEAFTAVRQGTRSTDAEIQARCVLLLPRLRVAAWQQRAADYLHDTTAAATHELPYQALFEKRIGKDLPARTLFATMLRSNGELLEDALGHSSIRNHSLIEPTRHFLERDQDATTTHETALGTVAALLWLNIVLPETHTERALLDLLQHPCISKAIQSRDHGMAFRILLVEWLKARTLNDVHALVQFIRMVNNTPFPEAIPQLVVAATDQRRCGLTIRVPAVNALAALGGTTAERTLLALLNDESLVSGSLGGGPKYLVCDSSLAGLVRLRRQPTTEYQWLAHEFNIVVGHSGPETQITLYGFETDALRRSAFARWRNLLK